MGVEGLIISQYILRELEARVSIITLEKKPDGWKVSRIWNNLIYMICGKIMQVLTTLTQNISLVIADQKKK